MGNGATVDTRQSFAMMEETLQEAASLQPKLTRGCNIFLQNEDARTAFIDYITSGTWLDVMQSNNFVSWFPDGPIPPVQVPAADQQEMEKFLGYDLPIGLATRKFEENFESNLSNREEKTLTRAEMVDSCFSNSSMRPLLLAALFPMFLKSSEYEAWQEERRGQEGKELRLPLVKLHNRDARLDELFTAFPVYVSDIIMRAVKAVDRTELSLLLSSGGWFQNLLSSVEDLPICVTLATARPERPGFPLVYVNKTFEAMTKYSREKILGHNCSFLQSNKTEKAQVEKLRIALQYAQPVKVLITNVRSDGTEFLNLLAMKPIFDSDGVYSYVIGVQFDVTNPARSYKQIMLVDDLLSIMPNVIN